MGDHYVKIHWCGRVLAQAVMEVNVLRLFIHRVNWMVDKGHQSRMDRSGGQRYGKPKPVRGLPMAACKFWGCPVNSNPVRSGHR